MGGRRGFLYAFSILSSLVILFILSPLIYIFLAADYGLVSRILFLDEAYVKEVWGAFLTTFNAATLSTTFLILTGVPLGYLLSRYEFRFRSLVESVINIPFLLPHSVAGIFILITYGSKGPVGEFLANLGMRVEDSFWGIIAAMAFVSAPILINTVRDGFTSIERDIEYVARSLGAGPLTVFLEVSLPLASRSIVTGCLLSWARAVSEVGALLIVAYYPKTINILVIEWFNTYGLSMAIALTIPLILLSILLFLLVRKVAGRELG